MKPENHILNHYTTIFEKEKEASDRNIEVLLKSKLTGEIFGKRTIKRALLARYMQPLTDYTVSAHKGKFVIEV